LGRVNTRLMPPLLRALLGGETGPAIDELGRATAAHPDGMLFYLRGMLLTEKQRLAEAERDFRAAAERPAFMPIRRVALFAATYCQWELGDREKKKDPAAAQALWGQALQSARTLVDLGGLTPDMANLVTALALARGELDLARRVLDGWERQDSRDLRPLRRRMAVELKAGAYGPAIAAADRILARQPGDAEAREARAAAVKRLVQQAKDLQP
jgi:tetratricopeptide (TPR) repeat protein